MALNDGSKLAMEALLKHPTHGATLKDEVLKSGSSQLASTLSAFLWNKEYFHFAIDCLGQNNGAVRAEGFKMVSRGESMEGTHIKERAGRKGFLSQSPAYQRGPLKQREIEDLHEWIDRQ